MWDSAACTDARRVNASEGERDVLLSAVRSCSSARALAVARAGGSGPGDGVAGGTAVSSDATVPAVESVSPVSLSPSERRASNSRPADRRRELVLRRREDAAGRGGVSDDGDDGDDGDVLSLACPLRRAQLDVTSVLRRRAIRWETDWKVDKEQAEEGEHPQDGEGELDRIGRAVLAEFVIVVAPLGDGKQRR
mmetsp:Transcript_10764/g.34146  ORF Transcript_10764/g.34146 Transcript_10764/m.34146 type:complete len:193 (+) Transcript_10764:951-1529(+)